MGFILKTIAGGAALLLAGAAFTGVTIAGTWPAFLAALVLGVFNALIRPVLIFLTLPINFLTLGLFTFVINGLLLWLVASLVTGVAITGFWWAVLAALVVSFIVSIVDGLLDDE